MPGGAGLTTLGLWLHAARPPPTTTNSRTRPILVSSRLLPPHEVRSRARASSATVQGPAAPAGMGATRRIVAAARSRRAAGFPAASPSPRDAPRPKAHDAAQGANR